ncbi:hypothetical protein PUR57_10430 [Streptomyces sp. JV176]|uniref:hypothetical protein n=1 Tax=Streptomyces sp. JV176 TaxID=858630 RepID=UPI002E770708|nr:hypothetical protein [Streptomyces sp. JV176]MEE1799083.1 hypothetical protein [Streptomyces sp. JV176]
MTTLPGKYADFEGLRTQVVALRREGLSLRQIRDRLKIHNNDILGRLVKGEPPPEWTKRPNAKDDLRDQARELRLKGLTYDQIQVELGCSKSSISLWVRDLPKPPARTREQASTIAKRGWEATMKRREDERQHTRRTAASKIGAMSDRELFILGVGLYWSEGAKARGDRPQERVSFINSDRHMIEVFLAWIDLLGVDRNRLRYQVQIHESADIPTAERFWREVVGADDSAFTKTILKRHNPKTNRKNVGDGYYGCLGVRVLQSAELYRRIEGWWYGIVGATPRADHPNRT